MKHKKISPSPLKNTRMRLVGTAVLGAGLAVPTTFMSASSASAASVSAWDKIAKCESSGLWNRPDGDYGRSSGGLQFQPASWNDALKYLRSKGIDTSGYPQGSGHQAYKATKKQQIIAGEALLALQGPNAWACNRMVGYPLQSSGSNASMFKGGTNPYPASSTPTTPKPTTPAPSTGSGTYTVVSGDSLSSIAKAKLGSVAKWKELYELNKTAIGSNPNMIYPGQKLKLSAAVKYTVKKGDTLSGIAKSHKLSDWKPLYEANKGVIGSNPNLIEVGMVLIIPSGGVTPPATTNPKPPASSGYAKPINARVTQNYHNPGNYSLGYHTGTDFSAPTGTRVNAIANGTVVASDSSSAFGVNVQIKHTDGKYSMYAHLSARTVSVGQTVTAGQQIGKVGSTGNSTGPHLHLEVRIAPRFAAGNFLDAVSYLAGKGITL